MTHDGPVSRRPRRQNVLMLRLRLTLLLCLLAFAGFASKPVLAIPRPDFRDDVGVRISKYARRFIGVPYAYGGTSPQSGFDCSGFVAYVYGHFGIALPHYTYAQFELGQRVGRRGLEPGDLVFFDALNHVGVYIGRGSFIHAPHTGASVRIEPLSSAGPLAGARRIA
jgi:cell wall-associated NlpC family hydrolase